MPRPTKQTVDYFPHFVADSKTKFMLENRFGNDGYAFWFKLLELLCRSDGHYFDCNNIADWEYLLALTKVSEQTAFEIMEKLSEMGKIDNELWAKKKFIWCSSLVANLAPVYAKRTVSLPEKPQIEDITEFPHRKPTELGVIGADNPQSKVKESRLEESITPPISPRGNEIAKIPSGESLLVETAISEPLQVSPSKTRKSRKKAELSANQRISFDKFWAIWPNKVSKGQAEFAWAKLDPDEGFVEVIISGVNRAKKLDKRFLDGFTPHPATWLNAKGWLDEFSKGGANDHGKERTDAIQRGFIPSTGFRHKA